VAIVASSVRLKPRPHQQQCRNDIVECYKSNDSFDKVERCFDIVATAAVDRALEAHLLTVYVLLIFVGFRLRRQ